MTDSFPGEGTRWLHRVRRVGSRPEVRDGSRGVVAGRSKAARGAAGSWSAASLVAGEACADVLALRSLVLVRPPDTPRALSTSSTVITGDLASKSNHRPIITQAGCLCTTYQQSAWLSTGPFHMTCFASLQIPASGTSLNAEGQLPACSCRRSNASLALELERGGRLSCSRSWAVYSEWGSAASLAVSAPQEPAVYCQYYLPKRDRLV